MSTFVLECCSYSAAGGACSLAIRKWFTALPRGRQRALTLRALQRRPARRADRCAGAKHWSASARRTCRALGSAGRDVCVKNPHVRPSPRGTAPSPQPSPRGRGGPLEAPEALEAQKRLRTRLNTSQGVSASLTRRGETLKIALRERESKLRVRRETGPPPAAPRAPQGRSRRGRHQSDGARCLALNVRAYLRTVRGEGDRHLLLRRLRKRSQSPAVLG